MSQWKKTCLLCRRRGFDPWVGKIPLEKEMTTHSSLLAWRIPRTEESSGLQSTGSQRVGPDGAHAPRVLLISKIVSFPQSPRPWALHWARGLQHKTGTRRPCLHGVCWGKQTWSKSVLRNTDWPFQDSLQRDRELENKAGKSEADQDKLLWGGPSAE